MKKRPTAKNRRKRQVVLVSPVSTFRIFFIFMALFLCSVLIVYRVIYLQSVKQTGLKQLARGQYQKRETIQANRGAILDRNGVELAVSLPLVSAAVNPKLVRNPKTAAKKLAEIMDISEKRLLKIFQSDKHFAWVKRQISLQQFDKIQSIVPEGFYAIPESRRFYPHKELAAHIMGFVGTDGNGLEGLEFKFENLLSGGKRTVELKRDARGRSIDLRGDLSQLIDLAGFNVTLTIDRNIQHIAERELKTVCKKTEARGGNIVVMSPQTGEILAMANWPSFDPNRFQESSADFRKNKAIVDVFEPGSSLKPFILAKALEKKRIKKDEKIFCEEGQYFTKGKVIHDVKPQGWLTPENILKFSSNICAFKIAERFTKEELYQGLLAFGFGEKTGIAIAGESRGIVRPWKDWHGVTQGNIGFGQGIAVTTLQLATAFSALANNGQLIQPRIIRSVKDSVGNIMLGGNQTRIVRRSVPKGIAKEIRKMMIAVTQKGGSGTLARIPGYLVAGKTGTSQKSDPQNGGYREDVFVSSFIGIVPARQPVLVVAVIIDEPKGNAYGGTVAAPVFRRVAQQTLLYLGVKPEMATPPLTLPLLTQVQIPQKMSPKSSHAHRNMPDLRGLPMRDALKNLENFPGSVHLQGFGIVFDQLPKPGEEINKNSSFLLMARPHSQQISMQMVSEDKL